jgi:hypothetical protein
VLCAIKFASNTKPNFASVIRMCKKAARYSEEGDGGEIAHSVAFARTHQDIKLAAAIMAEMNAFGWKFLLYANDRVQNRKANFSAMLECFCVASKLKDPTIHCHETLEDPFNPKRFKGTTIEVTYEGRTRHRPGPPKPATAFWTLPCKRIDWAAGLDGHVRARAREALLAAAIDRNVNVCPLFDVEAFKPAATRVEASAPDTLW